MADFRLFGPFVTVNAENVLKMGYGHPTLESTQIALERALVAAIENPQPTSAIPSFFLL